jgi:hypothetical protein
MVIKYKKWPQTTPKLLLNIPTFSIQRPSKIHPNWDVWSENKPPGNPDASL